MPKTGLFLWLSYETVTVACVSGQKGYICLLFLYTCEKSKQDKKTKQGNLWLLLSGYVFVFLESSIHVVKFSHDVGVFTGKAEAVKDDCA